MKLKKNFITKQMDGRVIMVPVGEGGFNGMIRGNGTTGEIVELLKKETTPAAIVEAMLAKYDAPKEKVEEDVEKVLAALRSVGAIDE